MLLGKFSFPAHLWDGKVVGAKVPGNLSVPESPSNLGITV